MFFRQFYILFLLSLTFLLGCSEEGKIKNTCNQFMKGRIALNKGDSSILEQVTEDSLFKLILLNEEYIKVLNAPGINPNLNIYSKSIKMMDSCAICVMSGLEYYQIHLCKYKGLWKVEAENWNYPTAERIKELQMKIAKQRKFNEQKPAIDSALLRLNAFFDGAEVYFKTQDLTLLRELCDESTIQFVQNLYRYARQKTGLKKLIEEMEKPKFLTSDVYFDSRKTTCKFYNEEITVIFQKKGDSHIVSGINGIDSKDITKQMIKERYPDFLRALNLIRPEKYRDKNLF